jgi:hypothetical protein
MKIIATMTQGKSVSAKKGTGAGERNREPDQRGVSSGFWPAAMLSRISVSATTFL